MLRNSSQQVYRGVVAGLHDALVVRLEQQTTVKDMENLPAGSPLRQLISAHGNYAVQGFKPGSRILIGKQTMQKYTTRMVDAVERIQEAADSGDEFAQLLLGNTGAKSMEQRIGEFSAAHLPKIDVDEEVDRLQKKTEETLGLRLNKAQEDTLRKALTTSLCLIQGCPGSGKTLLASVILRGLGDIHNRNKTGKMVRQVLCCTSTNVASDNIALQCLRAKMSVVRVTPASQKNYDGVKGIEPIILSNIVKNKVVNRMYVINDYLTEEENELILGYITSQDTYEFKKMCKAWLE